MGTHKHPACYISESSSNGVPLSMGQMTPSIIKPTLIGKYCQLLGHTKVIYRRALGLC